MSAIEEDASFRRTDFLLAFVAMLVALMVNAVTGFSALTQTHGDNDSLLRLVEVRDLLAGQGWFDLHQYRMGPQGGFVMHWSRLVDAPIAAIVIAATAVTGSPALAESVAKILWPALTYGITVFFLVRASRSFGGKHAVLPAGILGAAALFFIGIFSPGALDHHNVQVMLTVASLSLLVDAPGQRRAGLLSGLCAALTLAVGMETAPYVAVIGLCVAAFFAFGGNGEARIAREFGLGFAATASLVFVATIAPSSWRQAQCDAFSVVQFVVAAMAGTGLVLASSLDAASRTRARRLASLVMLGALIGAVVLWCFPACLASPFSTLDPRLRALWLDHISEAQSLFELAADDPASVMGRYVTPLLAILLLVLRFRQHAWRRQDSLIAAVLVGAVVVGVWQVRGTTFSIALAVIPLSAWVATWRERANADRSTGVSLKMVAVWLLSLNAFWMAAAAAAATATGDDQAGADASTCTAGEQFATLAALPDTKVLAISNLGSPILAYTGHGVLAGPYHRNVEGNLLVIDAFMGSAEAAKAIVEAQHIGIVAVCRGNPESVFLAEKAPRGFLAGLLRSELPAWLEPVAGTAGKPLELYHVQPTD